eukprot:CAMPEP_0168315354 /NCGR_PEP_ID=MMETSP0210-20121227/10931_1 /TAXON_ID=40633 /ORGANISM="Condylostoma magnum, Strain COL2" /LENGTH=43 /DNA_ID= /DNA_START= /DNA_END= /DNA_ORIENTATION=
MVIKVVDSNVFELMRMGFDEEVAEKGLQEVEGDLNLAISRLLA